MNLRFGYILLTFSLLATVLTLSNCLKEDDGSPAARDLPTVSVADIGVAEGDTDEVHTLDVTLSGTQITNAVVKYAAIPGTAITPDDYQLLGNGQLIFAPGETKKQIQFKITGDKVFEPKELFKIKLYNPSNAVLSPDVATVTIDDNDNGGALQIPSGGYVSPSSYPGYTLAWADEFNGTSLNTNDWNYELGEGGWGNNELQYYRQENTSIVDGNLVITAKKQSFGNSAYTSSRLTTQGKKTFKYGRIDIRAALPEGKGLWPALWMLGSSINSVPWPACGEVDIMELTGDQPSRVLSTVHFGPNSSQHQYRTESKYLSGSANFHDEFHVFSLVWVEDKMEFLVDNEVFYTVTPATLNGAAYPFNNPFFLIFNVAVGGALPGAPDASTSFPQYMIVDYVRVFQ